MNADSEQALYGMDMVIGLPRSVGDGGCMGRGGERLMLSGDGC